MPHPRSAFRFELLPDLSKLMPQRVYLLWGGMLRRAITASDAAYESGKGSAGFLFVIDPGKPEETRLGRVVALPGSLYSIWESRITYVARLELLAVLAALTEVARLFRGMSSVQLVDNVAALMALVKGSSGSRALDQMAKIIRLACSAIRSVPYLNALNPQLTGQTR